ncbi:MAG: 30S ribosomal protein S8 [Candidatus Aenigmarchaeota archaeon]|nr:30S ribosomal protein S8 [Candidatus Aenigmarchaeota archaeon]
MLQDTLADALTVIKNAEKIGRRECTIKSSKLLEDILKIMKDNGYIGNYENVKDGKGNLLRVELKGKIIDARVIKPRFAVKTDEYEKWEKRFLPAKNIGILILSTPKGIMTHYKAKESNTGGRLVSYVY